MEMEINLVDKLILLALNDDSGSFDVEDDTLAYLLAGGVVFALTFHQRIALINKKIHVINENPTGDKFLDNYLAMILENGKNISLKKWIEKLNRSAEEIKHYCLEKLIGLGILVKKEEKFLIFFSVDVFPTENDAVENSLRKRLDEIITLDLEPKVNEIMLLCLIDSCQVTKAVFGQEKFEIYKPKLKKMIASYKETKLMGETVQAIQEEMGLALMLIIFSGISPLLINP